MSLNEQSVLMDPSDWSFLVLNGDWFINSGVDLWNRLGYAGFYK